MAVLSYQGSGIRAQGSVLSTRRHAACAMLVKSLKFLGLSAQGAKRFYALSAVPCSLEVLCFVLQREVVVQIIFLVIKGAVALCQCRGGQYAGRSGNGVAVLVD